MQRIAVALIAATIAMLMSIGCSSQRSIPDDELAEILHDVYLTNAYINVHPFELDSVAIYEPILARYGYSVEDFKYTIGSFSRRKSAQLGTVLRDAETLLLEQTKILDKQVVILDTIRDVAVRTYRRTIRQDSLIEAKKLADTQKLHIRISPLYPGNYTVKFNYENEEEAGKEPLRGAMYLICHDGSRRSNYMYNLQEKDFVRRNFVVDSSHKELVIDLRIRKNEPRSKKSKKRRKVAPNLTIRNFNIEYIPDEKVAIDSLLRQWIDVRVFDDEFFCTPQDSVALGSDSLRVD
ncbi:MAG: DUF4296 domain-containing protein [Alistipes sp.]|nr:DUF4296 domain-containing protein [Alistipes sp.]